MSEADGFMCASNLNANPPCVLARQEGRNFVFYSLDPTQGKGGRLGKIEVSHPEPAYWTNSAWNLSPDGSSLALVDARYKAQIEVLTLTNGKWREIATDSGAGDPRSVAWAADGKSLFMNYVTPDSFNLLHVALDGKMTLLHSGDRGQYFDKPIPSPDGKYLAFQTVTFDANVWIIDNF